MSLIQGPIGSQTDDSTAPYCRSKTIASVTGDLTFSPPVRAIRVGVAGALALTFPDLSTDVLTLAAGETCPILVTGIAVTGTTATAITVFW